MNENENVQALGNTQPEDNGGKSEKTFTQEEVNKIVSDRLARERARNDEGKNSVEDKKAAELTARENKLTCREYLLEKNYPMEMLDSLDTSDPEKFKTTADSIYNAVCNKSERRPLPAPAFSDGRVQASPKFMGSENSDIVGNAFKHSQKHIPRKYPGM